MTGVNFEAKTAILYGEEGGKDKVCYPGDGV